VAQGGAAEVRLGELARLTSPTPAVKELAQRLIDDHGKANDALKQIADRKGIQLPGLAGSKHEDLYQRLSSLKGAEFDKAYVRATVDEHRLDIADFQKQADTSGDPDLKSFAIKTLPVLQEHLRLAELVMTQVEK
jgi:putative membrane protein